MPRPYTPRLWLHLCALVLLCSLGSVPTQVFADATNPQATAAVRSVKLTDALLKRMSAATLEATAALRDKDSVMSLTDDQDRPRTIDALIAEVEASPEAQTALARQHLSSREFVLTSLALINGYSAAIGMQATHTLDARTGATPEQMHFCQQHMPQIAAMYSIN